MSRLDCSAGSLRNFALDKVAVNAEDVAILCIGLVVALGVAEQNMERSERDTNLQAAEVSSCMVHKMHDAKAFGGVRKPF